MGRVTESDEVVKGTAAAAGDASTKAASAAAERVRRDTPWAIGRSWAIDACDLSTAFGAADLDYKVIVPRDVVRGSSPEMERAALDIISSYVGLVVESDDLLGEWTARRAVARRSAA